MLVGIMADSHGREIAVGRAFERFDALGVEFVIHCGDVGGPETFDHLVGRRCAFVWGNTDAPGASLTAYLESVGVPLPPAQPPLRLELNGRVFLVFHGHEAGLADAIAAETADYVLHGHTHQTRDERYGRTRVINPGALFRAVKKTVATLDTTTDDLLFHEISGTRF
jgi:putative phosphoesterase